MECRRCPACGRKVYSADASSTWECPYVDCGFIAITVECITDITDEGDSK